MKEMRFNRSCLDSLDAPIVNYRKGNRSADIHDTLLNPYSKR